LPPTIDVGIVDLVMMAVPLVEVTLILLFAIC